MERKKAQAEEVEGKREETKFVPPRLSQLVSPGQAHPALPVETTFPQPIRRFPFSDWSESNGLSLQKIGELALVAESAQSMVLRAQARVKWACLFCWGRVQNQRQLPRAEPVASGWVTCRSGMERVSLL